MIPEQLKDCLFCKINFASKKPYERGWPTKLGYNYYLMNETLNNFYENYGVLTGHNSLGVLDDDTPDKMLMKLYDSHFKKTFRIIKIPIYATPLKLRDTQSLQKVISTNLTATQPQLLE